MPVTQDRLTRLREFGLSEYAARSYLALLDLGIAEARDVSSISKVPQAKIYHVLEQLHEKGLVAILPEFPKKYAPVPFDEYLTRLYDEHTKAASGIEEQRAELADMFRVMGDTDVGDRGFFTVIRGRRNVLSRIEEMLAQTQKELLVLGTVGTVSRASHMANELRRLRERGAAVRMLAPVTEATITPLAALGELVTLRARDLGDVDPSEKVAILVSDGVRAFLIHFVPDDGNLYTGKDIGVFTDQEAMVAAIQALVEPHWTRATAYARRREDIELARETGATLLQPHDVGIGALFPLVHEGVLVVDPEDRIALWNPSAERVFGRAARATLGTPVRDLVAPRAQEELLAALKRAREGDRPAAAPLELDAAPGAASARVLLTLTGPILARGRAHVLVLAREAPVSASAPRVRA